MIVTVTVDESLAAVPAVPLNIGVVSLVWVPLAGADKVTVGAAVSTVNVCTSL